MLTLITFPEGYDQLSVSPFCVKAMYLLTAAGQDWKREDSNDPRRMPRAKLPVLRTPTGLVHDSENIRLYLEENGANFCTGLSMTDRAASHAFVRMAEEHMYFVQVLDRWERDEVWPTVRDRYFREIPKMLRGTIAGGLRRRLLKGMNAQGLGRLTWEERLGRVNRDLAAIETRLSDTEFLFANHPTLADYSVGPILAGMRGTPVATPLSRHIADNQRLSDYIDRLDAAMGQV